MFQYEDGSPLNLENGMLVKDTTQYYFWQLTPQERAVLGVVEIADIPSVYIPDPKYTALNALSASDSTLPRNIEDLIDTLIIKGVIVSDDLPGTLQTNYETKKTLRADYLALVVVEEEIR